MNFWEALKEVDALGSSWLGGRFDHWTPGEVSGLVRKLQEYYAPTIEMTTRQYEALSGGYDLSSVIARLERSQAYAEEVGEPEPELSDEQIALAFVYPELIKIVEE